VHDILMSVITLQFVCSKYFFGVQQLHHRPITDSNSQSKCGLARVRTSRTKVDCMIPRRSRELLVVVSLLLFDSFVNTESTPEPYRSRIPTIEHVAPSKYLCLCL
jgi:hypothetical protein